MTHPHEGLREPALREALQAAYEAGAMDVHQYWQKNLGEAPRGDPEFEEAAKDCASDLLASLPTPPVPHDQGLRDALANIPDEAIRHIAEAKDVASCRSRIARALSTLPQQVATEEAFCCGMGWPTDDGHAINCPKHERYAEFLKLSTPTSQPPAAETRLREALEPFAMEASEYDNMDGEPDYKNAPDESSLEEINDLTVGHLRRAREAWSAAGYARAALTQPEPTAQQGGEEEQVSGTFSCPICGKDTPHYHSQQEVDDHNETEAWVEESLQKFRALEADHKSAQQAAGEADAVAWQRNHPVQGWIDCRQEDVAHYERQGQATRALYATPQPTETELAHLRAENERLSKAVMSSILPDLLNEEETGALVDFVKSLRGQSTPQPTETVEELGQRAHYDECQALLTKHGVKPTLAESNTGPATIHSVGIVNAMLEFANRHRIAAQPTETQRIVAWRPIDDWDRNGIVLALAHVQSVKTGASWNEYNVIWADDEAGAIHPDCERGWQIEDYAYFMPLPEAPASGEHLAGDKA